MSLWVGGCLGVLEPGLYAHRLLPLPPLMATRPRQLLGLKGEAQMLARHCPPRLLRTRSDPFPGLLGRLEPREGPWGRVTWGSPPAPHPLPPTKPPGPQQVMGWVLDI